MYIIFTKYPLDTAFSYKSIDVGKFPFYTYSCLESDYNGRR
jgi:hypothetical protein